jgi:23S rRNA pseudouridine2605 synthase
MPTDSETSESKRLLQWIQQQAGISRRKAEELISGGEVTVDGCPVTNPFHSLDRRHTQRVALRGHPLSLDPTESRVYRFHKPAGMLCSRDDRFSGNTVGRVLRSEGFIGYTWAGRLDQDAEGLLIVTNDGGLVNAFTHPRYGIQKTYRAWLRELPKRNVMESVFSSMQQGITDQGDELRAVSAAVEGRPPHVRLVLAEGKKHEVKRLFAHFGLEVTRLLRVGMGPVVLSALPSGQIERLSQSEESAALRLARRLLAADNPGLEAVSS